MNPKACRLLRACWMLTQFNQSFNLDGEAQPAANRSSEFDPAQPAHYVKLFYVVHNLQPPHPPPIILMCVLRLPILLPWE